MRGVFVIITLVLLSSVVLALDCSYADKLDANNPCEDNPSSYHYILDFTNTSVALAGFNTSYRYGICCNVEPSIQRFDNSSNDTLVRISGNMTAMSCHDNPLTGENCSYAYDI